MKSAVTLIALFLSAATALPAFAQGTTDKPISAVPPSGAGRESTSTTPSSAASGPSSTVVPGAAYNNGSANVGNSSETNGVAGAQGATAGATMQGGHTSNR